MINFSKQYNRLFTIGCSFTQYRHWPTWAPALAMELNVPLYNLGCTGASNPYIAQQLFLLDKNFNLTEDDLVITQWSGHIRHSKIGHEFYDPDLTWYHSGNIDEIIASGKQISIKQHLQDNSFITHTTLLLQSLTMIQAALLFQKTLPCTCVNLQMSDIIYKSYDAVETDIMLSFEDISKEILPSFLNVFYPEAKNFNEVRQKHYIVKSELHSKNRKKFMLNRHQHTNKIAMDLHPLPTEHVSYMETVFNHQFSQAVKDVAARDEETFFSVEKVPNFRTKDMYEFDRIEQIFSLPLPL